MLVRPKLLDEVISYVGDDGKRVIVYHLVMKAANDAGVKALAQDTFTYKKKFQQAHLVLAQTIQQIAQQKTHIGVLETEWQNVASPKRIQQLAQAHLNMADTASVQLSSFDQLPRKGDAPLNNSPVHAASAQVPAASDSGM